MLEMKIFLTEKKKRTLEPGEPSAPRLPGSPESPCCFVNIF